MHICKMHYLIIIFFIETGVALRLGCERVNIADDY